RVPAAPHLIAALPFAARAVPNETESLPICHRGLDPAIPLAAVVLAPALRQTPFVASLGQLVPTDDSNPIFAVIEPADVLASQHVRLTGGAKHVQRRGAVPDLAPARRHEAGHDVTSRCLGDEQQHTSVVCVEKVDHLAGIDAAAAQCACKLEPSFDLYRRLAHPFTGG